MTEHIFYVKQQHKGKDLIQFFAIHKRFLLQYQSIHGLPDRVHVQIPLWSGLIAMQWKRIYQIPFVLTEHYGIYNLLVDVIIVLNDRLIISIEVFQIVFLDLYRLC